MAGPLSGLTIIEMAGLGPGPFAAMMLADHGASVIRIERKGMIGVPNDPLLRSRRSISLDLRRDECRDVVRRLAASADGLIEGYRPGVMEIAVLQGRIADSIADESHRDGAADIIFTGEG